MFISLYFLQSSGSSKCVQTMYWRKINRNKCLDSNVFLFCSLVAIALECLYYVPFKMHASGPLEHPPMSQYFAELASGQWCHEHWTVLFPSVCMLVFSSSYHSACPVWCSLGGLQRRKGKKRDLEMDSEVCSSQLDLELENGSAKGTASSNFVSTQNWNVLSCRLKILCWLFLFLFINDTDASQFLKKIARICGLQYWCCLYDSYF